MIRQALLELNIDLRMKPKSILVIAAICAVTLFVLNMFLPADLAVKLGLNGKAPKA